MGAAFADAEALAAHFPGLHEALRAGRISAQHVRVLITSADPVRDAVRDGCLPEATLAVYEAACLVVAEQDSPARTRVHARQIAATLAGENLEERHARATAERCVSVKALEDGMALLTVVLPEIYAAAIKDRLSRLAGAIAADTRGETERALGIAFTDPVTDPGATIAAGATFALDPEHDLHDPATDTCAAKKVGPDARREFVAIDGRTRRQIEADVLIDLLLAGSPSEILGSGWRTSPPRCRSRSAPRPWPVRTTASPSSTDTVRCPPTSLESWPGSRPGGTGCYSTRAA